MALLATLNVDSAGLTPAYVAAAAGGDTFANDGRQMLHVKNGGGAPITVTVTAINKCNHGSLHNYVVSVTNAQERMIGPFPVAQFGDAPAITYSAVTTVTVAAIRLPTV